MSTINPDVSRLKYTVVVSSGEGTQSLPDGLANKIIQIVVIPPNTSAEYYVYIKDNLDNMYVFKREDDIVGTYNELISPSLPLFGNNILEIKSATVDGNYKVRIVYE